MENKKYLMGHDSEENAFVRFKMRGHNCQSCVKYWIETKKNYGQRLCYRTCDNKNNKWFAVKKGVYSEILVMHVNNVGDVSCEELSKYSNYEKVMQFKDNCLDFLDDVQKDLLKYLIVLSEISKNVTYTITEKKPISLFAIDRDQQLATIAIEEKENEANEVRIMKNIKAVVNFRYRNIKL